MIIEKQIASVEMIEQSILMLNLLLLTQIYEIYI